MKAKTFWSARTRPRFPTGRRVSQSKSGVVTPQSKTRGDAVFTATLIAVIAEAFLVARFIHWFIYEI